MSSQVMKWAVGLSLLGIGGMPPRLPAQGADTPRKTSNGETFSPPSVPTYIEVRSVLPGAVEQAARPNRVVNYGLKYDDIDRLVATVAAVTTALPIREINKQFRHGANSIAGRVVGTTHEYAGFNALEMDRGRFLTDADNARFENYAVVGSAVAQALVPEEDPVGKSVKLGSDYYKVVGVVKERANASGIGGAPDPKEANRDVFIPLNTCKLRFGERVLNGPPEAPRYEECQLSRLVLQVRDGADVEATAALVKSTLRPFHPREDVEVVVLKPDGKAE